MNVGSVVRLLICAVVLSVLATAEPASAAASSCTRTGSNLAGGSGRDVLCGTSGNDVLIGNEGDDDLRGAGGNDALDGSAGDDSLGGGAGADTVTGGFGFDSVDAGDGNDSVRLRDGELDNVGVLTCGFGSDSLDIDLKDKQALTAVDGLSLFITVLTRSCENVTVGAFGEGPNVTVSGQSLSVGEDGRTAVRLHCPGSLDIPCAGSLRLGIPTKSKKALRQPLTHYSIAAGESHSVRVRLSSHDRRTLNRRRHANGLVLSIEKGHLGDKTSAKTLKLLAAGTATRAADCTPTGSSLTGGSGELIQGCENITVGAVNEGPNVVISARSDMRVDSHGRAGVSLRCPAALPADCKGTLTLALVSRRAKKAPKVSYVVPAGAKRTVRGRLSRADRRTLARNGTGTAVVTSVEQGDFGPKTTQQVTHLTIEH
jgi:RTX calcium-binding nonapeptide repeat (4 copies)